MNFRDQRKIAALALFALLGCQGEQSSEPREKAPRPVSVLVLQRTDPSRIDRVAGSVASWKTEDIGFEVPGRVEYVIEPETDVAGYERNAQGELISEATLLARLDTTRYELDVQSAQAEVESAQRQRDAVQAEITSVIPAQKRAAEAGVALAKSELLRSENLVRENAGSQAELDRAKANLDTAVARIDQLDANLEAKQAELLSLEAQIKQTEQTLAEARRNLEDCNLYSSFRGQVAAVRVIPGGYVQKGQAVVTVQMMDPIKVEFEVSAQTARALNYRDQIPVYIRHTEQADEADEQVYGNVYMTDPVADPQTRTFTVTLLLRNEKRGIPLPEDLRDGSVARTHDLWRILRGLPDMEEIAFLETDAIHEDEQGAFAWKVLNRTINTLASDADPVLQVQRIPLVPGKQSYSFLGLWSFSEVTIDPSDLDIDTEVVAGALTLPTGMHCCRLHRTGEDADAASQSWSGEQILFDRPHWLMRPGDVVRVDLSGRPTQPGFYVPVDAIRERSGKSYIFAVESAGDGTQVRQIEVDVGDDVGTLRKIDAAGEPLLESGMRLVAGGALFLHDGETVNVAEEVEVQP